MEEKPRCDDCGTAIGEIQIRVGDGLPVCEDCFEATQAKVSVGGRFKVANAGERRLRNQLEIAREESIRWRTMYEEAVRRLGIFYPYLAQVTEEDAFRHWEYDVR
jgi:hypothetical protein